MTSPSPTFTGILVDTINIKRGSKDGPTTVLTDVPCTAFAPVDESVRARMSTQVGVTVVETFVDGAYDIRRGDIAVLDSVDYAIRERERWTLPDGAVTVRLRMEKIA